MTATVPIAEVSTVWRPDFEVDLRAMIGSMRRGGFDPCHHHDRTGAVWRASRLPTGPVTYRLHQVHLREIQAKAWGPGAEEFIAGLPRMLGADDDLTGFVLAHPLLIEAQRHRPGLRVLRTGRVMESLIPAVIEQKITGKEAHEAWSWLIRRHGEPAPGPVPRPMFVPPDIARWRLIPSWDWHRAAIDPKRSATIMRALQYAGRLEQCADLDHDAARRRLTAIPGVGVWTAAETAQRALGDPDAVSVGDYHLAGFVGFSLIGKKVDDDGMLELLEPWRGHRYRVIRLLETTSAGVMPPRHGPRITIADHRTH